MKIGVEQICGNKNIGVLRFEDYYDTLRLEGACAHYEASDAICRLLKRKEYAKLRGTCRLPYTLFTIQRSQLEARNPDLAIEFDEAKIFDSIEAKELKDVSDFYRYVWRACKNKALDLAVKKAITAKRYECGSCAHLSGQPEYICLYLRQPKAPDDVCGDYAESREKRETFERRNPRKTGWSDDAFRRCHICVHFSEKAHFCEEFLEIRQKGDRVIGISTETLQTLRAANISKSVIFRLYALKNQRYGSKTDLREAIFSTLGEEDAAQYVEQIMKFAQTCKQNKTYVEIQSRVEQIDQFHDAPTAEDREQSARQTLLREINAVNAENYKLRGADQEEWKDVPDLPDLLNVLNERIADAEHGTPEHERYVWQREIFLAEWHFEYYHAHARPDNPELENWEEYYRKNWARFSHEEYANLYTICVDLQEYLDAITVSFAGDLYVQRRVAENILRLLSPDPAEHLTLKEYAHFFEKTPTLRDLLQPLIREENRTIAFDPERLSPTRQQEWRMIFDIILRQPNAMEPPIWRSKGAIEKHLVQRYQQEYQSTGQKTKQTITERQIRNYFQEAREYLKEYFSE